MSTCPLDIDRILTFRQWRTDSVRIGLNLLHALPEVGGGWNYINNLIATLAIADQVNEYVAYVTDASAALVPARANFRSVEIPIQSRVRAQRILFENTVLPLLVRRDRLDCLHWFANGQGIVNTVPPVVTIYDLQPFLEYGRTSTTRGIFLRGRLRESVRSGAILLPMSQATARALHDMLGADIRRISVIPPMLEPLFTPAETAAVERCRTRHGLPPLFWLYVAHLYPHKNHERLLRAYRTYKQTASDPWPLVLRGDPQPDGPNLSDLATTLGLTGHIMFLPSLKRDELPLLYSAASALVFPSLYEGAGMPVLEAQACGCPVTASDIPAVKEFGGDAVSYFDPYDERDILRALIRTSDDPAGREELRERGLTRARILRTTPVIPRLIAAYKFAAKRPSAVTGAVDHSS